MLFKYGVKSSQPINDLCEGPHIRITPEFKAEVTYLIYDAASQSCESKLEHMDINQVGDNLFAYQKNKDCCQVSDQHSAPPTYYPEAKKILAIGDLHGEYFSLKRALASSGVIDPQGNWIFGDGHVVILGDAFDRGNQVTQILWEIYHLSQKAEKAGGYLHFLLGNHEWMALKEDHRYLHPDYVFLCEQNNIDYSLFFQSDFVLGNWLRSRNTVEKIGNILFVHGGLSMELAQAYPNLDEINVQMRRILNEELEVRRNSKEELLTGSYGPLWFRGYIMPWVGKSIVNQEDFSSILNVYNAKELVFGHTTQKHIQPFYNGMAYGIDVPFGQLQEEEVLLYEDGKWYQVHVETQKRELIS